MASRSMSPGGSLLRASRVFSIPKPLPRPAGTLSSQATFNSDSATLPYPIHQSITTPQSSLNKGDWGFKRPLPLRATTQTSTPIIRIEAIDTYEHVTDFASAADHSLTLQKWQEMNIPLQTPRKTKSDRATGIVDPQPASRSVFENDIDTIASPGNSSFSETDSRWKFNGPWLAGLTEGEFQHYIANEVGRKKSDFREFLRGACAADATRELRESPENDGAVTDDVVQASDITDEQLSLYIKRLRQDDADLFKHIRTFLDLPPSIPPPVDEEKLFDANINGIYNEAPVSQTRPAPVSTSPYAASGPPKTHPSAGLSYSRTANWIFNHPAYGPQRAHPPVQARIVLPKQSSTGNMPPRLGVGGVVTDTPQGADAGAFETRASQTREIAIPGLIAVEPEKVGGSKVYVSPQHASIDTKGRIVLTVGPADPECVAVKEGREDEIPERLRRPNEVLRGFEKPVGVRQNGSGVGYGLMG
ncbi:37S ribosomal mrp51 mitochondrial protein [Rutstroemia sp. NJR-2017a BVV2]|nr:37S ribosomal mrp51 mitochondrial protein [Rutstroemia sp. NJR-2017a BVV2]